MSVQSYKVWLVTENGYEHTTPLRAFSLRRQADSFACKMQSAYDKKLAQTYKEPLRFSVQQIDLIAHDGAHVLKAALLAAVGKNK